MKTFAINTLGCKVNQYESQQIRELLVGFGLHQVETSENRPELIVINTCCVTHTASAKSRQHIRKAQKLNPGAVTVVCGCLTAGQIDELHNLGKNTRLVSRQDALAATLSQIVNGKTSGTTAQCAQLYLNTTTIRAENAPKSKHKNKLANKPKLPPLSHFRGQTRAFLKVQDGCDGYCSYCIIPRTRPCVRSKPVEAALQEAKALVEAGHKEIVVTGIFLGAYGQASVRRKNWDSQRNDKLAELLEKMAQITGLARIRVSSLEPTDVTPQLLDTFCKHRNIMPHLHLSLQSGSDAVLKRMRRQYGTGEFMRTVETIKSRLDRPAITTDVIVGFPGETDADFEQTVNLAREAGFAKMHVFSFSPRKGTTAAGLQGAVDNRVIKERARMLRNLDTELGGKFREQFLGETAVILVENSDGQPRGRSERYFMVYLEKTGENRKKNELVSVKLTKNNEKGMFGRATTTELANPIKSVAST
jgi:threonylcarbamoyladenosine tRNA methylthiotransferase MtaB